MARARARTRGGPEAEAEAEAEGDVAESGWAPQVKGLQMFLFAGALCTIPFATATGTESFLSVFAVCFLAVEAVACAVGESVRAVIPWLGSWLAAHGGGGGVIRSRKTADKLVRQAWLLVLHSLGALGCHYLLFVRAPDPRLPDVWRSPSAVLDALESQQHAPELVLLYIAHLALWTYLGLLQVTFEARSKDQAAMLLHHTTTILLIVGSFRFNALRAGLLVFHVNMCSDVFIDVLRIANYLKLRGASSMFLSEGMFVVMMGTFFYFRILLLPFYVLPSILVRRRHLEPLLPAARLADPGTLTDALSWLQDSADSPFSLHHFSPYMLLNPLLLVLVGLNFYWFGLMVRIIWRIATAGIAAASKEEYEGDSDEEEGDFAARRRSPFKSYVILGILQATWESAGSNFYRRFLTPGRRKVAE
jgi:hypothetical protein